ncbi:Fibrous sheath-interacting protein 1 [Geranomyces variabilis]|nr:Fibrous sheath-interacting protein 1 [Geranomyces variabilis]
MASRHSNDNNSRLSDDSTDVPTRSQTATPIRKLKRNGSRPDVGLRRNSSRSEGGLTPLPDEDVPTILLTSGRASPTQSGASLQNGDLAAGSASTRASRSVSASSTPLPQPRHDEQTESDEGDIDTQLLINEMAQRRREFDDAEMEVRAELDLLAQDNNQNSGSDVVAQSAEPGVLTPSDVTVASVQDRERLENEARIQRGKEKIQELDAIIKQKNSVARALTRERLSRETSAATSRRQSSTSSAHDGQNEDDSTDDEEADSSSSVDLELRSVHSMETRTFLTEPKLGTRVKIGIQALKQAGGMAKDDTDRSAEDPDGAHALTKKKKGYKQGDFIQRNIVLGPDARYYSAMTEEESERVEQLLQATDIDDEGTDLFTTNFGFSGSTTNMIGRPTSAASSGFFPDMEDHERLIKIDRKLQLIIPEPEWETKSITWSTPASLMPSGARTPAEHYAGDTWGSSSVVSDMRDVETVLHDQGTVTAPEILLRDEQTQLAEIDAKLEALKEGESRPVTREEIDRLLYECMRFESEMRSRSASDWDIASVSDPSRCSSRAQVV